MTKKTFITMMLVLIAIAGWAQEEHIDTVIPKFLSNGYFFREMPTLPDGEKTMSRLKDKKGIVRHAVHGTNETKREELLAKIIEAEAE